jgi:hypothetical protein
LITYLCKLFLTVNINILNLINKMLCLLLLIRTIRLILSLGSNLKFYRCLCEFSVIFITLSIIKKDGFLMTWPVHYSPWPCSFVGMKCIEHGWLVSIQVTWIGRLGCTRSLICLCWTWIYFQNPSSQLTPK